MLNGDHSKAKNKYGAMAISAALVKYNALLAKQAVNGLTEEEVLQRNFFQDEFGFKPKEDPPPSSPHSHYFGGY